MSRRGAFVEEADGTLTKIREYLPDDKVDRPVKGTPPVQDAFEYTSLWNDRNCTIPTKFDKDGRFYGDIDIYIRNDSRHELKNIKFLFFRDDRFTRALKAEGPSRLYPGEVGKITVYVGDIDEFPLDAIKVTREGGEEYVEYMLSKLNIKFSLTLTVVVR